MAERLTVLLYGRVIGRLERRDADSAPTFRYDEKYVAAGLVPLSCRLPVTDTPYPPPRVDPYIRGLLPENQETRERWAQRLDVSPDDPFGMLAIMGWDCPGAVQFCYPDTLDDLTELSNEHVPISDSEIASRIRDLVEQPASWTMPGEHWSLGGQQEKFALAWVRGAWHEAHGSAATTHIFKPGIRVLKHQALVEHTTMRAAAELGITMANSQILQFDDQYVIVVERFDRIADGEAGIQRLHQEDFCQALGRPPEKKYESRGGPRLSDMANLVRRQMSEPEPDLLALADFAAINLVAGAPDGHAKNISILFAPDGMRWVAPLYDLATGIGYESERVERSVALSLGGERLFNRIRQKQWAKTAEILGLPRDLLLNRALMLAGRYPDAFEQAVAAVAHIPGCLEVAERTLPALRAHCKKLLDQMAS